VGDGRSAFGQPPLAINPVCRSGGVTDAYSEEKPGAGTLLALAYYIGKIFGSIFSARWDRKPFDMGARSSDQATRLLRYGATDWPGF
jgi:hypothetical protein